MKAKQIISLIVGITFVALSPIAWAAGHGGGGGGFAPAAVVSTEEVPVVVSAAVVFVAAVWLPNTLEAEP